MSRDLPPMGELQLPTPSLDEYYGTYSVDVGRSDSYWTQTSTSVFCVDQVEVCSVPDAASEYSIVHVFKLQLDSLLSPLSLYSTPLAVQTHTLN